MRRGRAGEGQVAIRYTEDDSAAPHYTLRRILSEAFDDLDFAEAACLVGLLYESDILLLGGLLTLPALEPIEAAHVVSDLFGHRANQLVRSFQDNWRSVKKSEIAMEVSVKLRSHDLVDSIVFR